MRQKSLQFKFAQIQGLSDHNVMKLCIYCASFPRPRQISFTVSFPLTVITEISLLTDFADIKITIKKKKKCFNLHFMRLLASYPEPKMLYILWLTHCANS